MTAAIFQPFYAAIDGNGVPMSGALLYFYKTGTTTPQDTYTDSGLGTPNANPVVADSNGLFPPIYLTSGPDYKAILKTSAGVTVATRDPIEAPISAAAVTLPTLRSYLAGLTLSAAGSSATFGIAAGQCADSTNTVLMTLAAALTKTTSAWSAGSGNGSLDTGTIANSTWYHVYLIQRTDTGTVDALVSTSVSSPTLPSPYTLKRRIGSMKTDGSAQWVAFVQDGDLFQWSTPPHDINNSNNPGTSAVLATLSVPLGLNVQVNVRFILNNLSNVSAVAAVLSDPATSDVTPSVAGAGSNLTDTPSTASASSNVSQAGARYLVRTNTSQQIRYRLNTSSTNISVDAYTVGWIDSRGKNS